MFAIVVRTTIIAVVVLIAGRDGLTVIDPIELTRKLIAYPTISPDDKGSLDYLRDLLNSLNFRCEIMENGEKTYPVRNLYARYGTGRPNLCFVGHVDIVPPGDLSVWTYPPYAAEIHDGILYGRGAVDMKSAIAAFLSAFSRLTDKERGRINGSVSLILTSNEEGPKNEYGTDSVFKVLEKRGEKVDFCLIGEPTNRNRLGDTIKIGRRGSITFRLKVYGKQGHVAYHELADNPIHRTVDILSAIKNTVLDNGTEYFQASNCEIVNVYVGNAANNVIPGAVISRINIRYNTLHTAESLTRFVKRICDRVADKYEISTTSSAGVDGGAFVNEINRYTRLLVDIVENHVGIRPIFSTAGGTSDARFVRHYCTLVEFGLVSKTAHHYDECTPVDDIYKLTDIYRQFIIEFFASTKRIDRHDA